MIVVVGKNFQVARPGASGRVGAAGVEFGDEAGEEVEVVPQPPGASLQALGPSPFLVAPDVLVVAVPESQARVRHDPSYVVADFSFDLAPQRLLLGVRGAGKQEVLPDQDAALVAKFVEVVGLEVAATPDAQQVHVGEFRLVHSPCQAGAVDAGDEGVVRDPVRASDPYRFAVHDKSEGGTFSVWLKLHFDGAEADPGGPGVDGGAAHARVHGEVIQGLVSESAWPPQINVGDGNLDCCCRAASGDGG